MNFPLKDSVTVHQAQPGEAPLVQEMLEEAAQWVDALGEIMWDEDELNRERVASEVAAGQFFIGRVNGEAAGVVKFQLEDRLFWPELTNHDSAFIHRLAVRRRFKGLGVSTALMRWAASRARGLGRRDLRLDCDASRPKLQRLYESFGFQFHSFQQVGTYYVARYVYPLSERDPHDAR